MISISILFVIYGLLLALILAAGIFVYRAMRKHGKVLAVSLGLLTVTVLSLLFPIPTHGGVTFVFEVIYHEWKSPRYELTDTTADIKRQAFSERMNARFRAPIEFKVIASLSGDWNEVMLSDERQAWFDTNSKLIWSEWLSLEANDSLPTLKTAKARCRDYPPAGFWALSTEAENVLLWQSRGQQILPATAASSVSYSVEEQFQIEVPSYILRNRNSRNNRQANNQSLFVVRCVARSEGAPPGGYSKKDIPLDLWNRYQLSKLSNE